MCFERSIQTKACLDLKYTQNDLSIQVIAIFQLMAKTKWQWHQLSCNYKCIGFLFSQEVAKPIYVVFTNSSSYACHSEKSTGSWQCTSQIIFFPIHTSKMLVFSLIYDKLYWSIEHELLNSANVKSVSVDPVPLCQTHFQWQFDHNMSGTRTAKLRKMQCSQCARRKTKNRKKKYFEQRRIVTMTNTTVVGVVVPYLWTVWLTEG